jgi:hypothetical protein
MSPVRLPDEDDMRAPLFRNRAPRRKTAAPAPTNPPKEPHREEGTDSPDDSPPHSKEDER